MMRILVAGALVASSAVVVAQTPPPATATTASPTYFASGPWQDVLQELSAAAEKCAPNLYELVTGGGETAPPGSPLPDGSYNVLENINAYFTSIAQGTCTDSEEQSLMTAMDNFETCTGGIDMKTFIELLPSAMLGGAIKCAVSISAESDLLSIETYTGPDGLPEACAETFFGSNPMGDMLRLTYLKPDVVFSCMSALSEEVPACKRYSFPMPIVGAWLKAASCFVGSMTPMMDLLCENELEALGTCLAGQTGGDICSAREGCMEQSLMMNMMPPFIGAPMPDACLRVAETKNLQTAVTLYDEFSSSCTTPWAGWSTPIGTSAS